MEIPYIKGKELDGLVYKFGLKRHCKFFIFKESDTSLRLRLLDRINAVSGGKVRPMHVKVGV